MNALPVANGPKSKPRAPGPRGDLVVCNLTDYIPDPIEIPRQPRRDHPLFVWRHVKVAHLTILWPGR